MIDPLDLDAIARKRIAVASRAIIDALIVFNDPSLRDTRAAALVREADAKLSEALRALDSDDE